MAASIDIPDSSQNVSDQRRPSIAIDQKGTMVAAEKDDPIEVSKDVNTSKIFMATSSILLIQMCERVSYYSVVANLVLFCTSKLGYSSVDAATTSLVFAGFVYLMPVLGGYISDAWLGRFTTMLISCVFILLGLVLLIAAAIDFSTWSSGDMSQTGKRACFILGLVATALGTGGLKANVSPFGAEQVHVLGTKAINSFFNWFYWITALGSILAFTGIAYIQQNISFVWGFFTPLLIFLLSSIFYVAAKPFYVLSKPQGSAIRVVFSVLREGMCRCGDSSHKYSVEQVRRQSVGGQESLDRKKKFLDGARSRFGGSHDDGTVEGVLSVITVLPFCALVIMFWAIYSQTQSSFFVQAVRMDVRVNDSKIPAAMIGSFTNLSIVLVIPVLDRIIYPCMTRIGISLTLMRKVGLGFLFSTLAVTSAGIVEIYRKEYLKKASHVQQLANENFTASSLSVFAQTPQFMLIGIGEIFTAATTLEIGYTQAPPYLQGLLTGLFYASSGVANFLTMGIMLVVREVTAADPWWGNEINDLKMENLMFLFAGLTLLNFIVFCLVAYRYSYKNAFNLSHELPVRSKNGSVRKLSYSGSAN